MWQKIESAKKDGSIILVDDANAVDGEFAPWAAAKWLSGREWSGWVYDDELLNDSNPLGPQPKWWLSVPALPI